MASRFFEADRMSFAKFNETVPKNKIEWEGSVVVFDAELEEFYDISFGTGDNLTQEDVDKGYDDYIMVERYGLDGTRGSAWVVVDAISKGLVDEYTDGLREIDGGQWILKRSEWTNGDIRRFILGAMEFAGYFLDVKHPCEHVVYITSGK